MTQWIGRFRGRMPIRVFMESGPGLVAGFREAGSDLLRDASGALRLPGPLLASLKPETSYWLAVSLGPGDEYELRYCRETEPSPEVADLRKRFGQCVARWSIHQAIRTFFYKNHFLEVDTPLMVACPGMEPYLDSFAVGDLFLRTSPELHMKRLLAAGFDRTFQMGPCFRAGDRGGLHREEFLMLEWYRAFADLDDLIDDLRGLLAQLSAFSPCPEYFTGGVDVTDCASLFQRKLGLHLRDHEDREPLRRCLRSHGIGYSDADDWDTLYFLLFLNFIEPKLGEDRPLILTDYPASQAALAKCAPIREGCLPVCYRFELYVRGMEIANAFYELTDPVEQRGRFEADLQKRQSLEKTVYPIDESFMAALDSGIPPSTGIALGVDRLVLALLGHSRLAAVLPFE